MQQTVISALSKEEGSTAITARAPGHQRTLKLPDEEFCEVARVDELPERGTRTRDGEGRAVLCGADVHRRQEARGGGDDDDSKKKESQPSYICFKGRGDPRRPR